MSAIASWRARAATVMMLLAGLALITMTFGPGGANAKGGTNKPPTAPAPRPATPQLANPGTVSFQNTATTAAANLHGFDLTGFVQHATIDDGTMCPAAFAADPTGVGGTVVINGLTVVIPCNTVVQMPANTLSWSDAVDITTHTSLALDGAPTPYPSFEISVTGNIVNDRYVGALVFVSQQSLNSGGGVITQIDYATGRLHVNSKPAGNANPDTIVEINDPSGRFGRAQSPDDRFSVDDENPTVHAGTGYPMCIPRSTTDPNAGGPDDALCPQRNRPSSGANGTACRNLTTALTGTGLPIPQAGDIRATPPNQRCQAFVMKPLAAFGPIAARLATDPDPREQVPFEVGDYITYSGTLFHGANGSADFISAHTVEGNVGVYTQPLTQPGYVAIGEFGVGSADPLANSVNGVPQESQDRIFLESETTDPLTLVDIYLTDVRGGSEFDRWITPFEMTGVNSITGPTVVGAGGIVQNVGGGLDTALNGPQMQRARLRATKAPLGWLNSPTRTVRVVQRTLCLPNSVHLGGATQLAYPAAAATGGAQIGGLVPSIDSAPNGSCTARMTVANGLHAGQYQAPTFEFIFPENVAVGDAVVPYDFWDLGFLAQGEGGTGSNGLSNGGLVPQPW